jgi:hypothetical protein
MLTETCKMNRCVASRYILRWMNVSHLYTVYAQLHTIMKGNYTWIINMVNISFECDWRLRWLLNLNFLWNFWDIFCSDKYLGSYTWDIHRTAFKPSCKLHVKTVWSKYKWKLFKNLCGGSAVYSCLQANELSENNRHFARFQILQKAHL